MNEIYSRAQIASILNSAGLSDLQLRGKVINFGKHLAKKRPGHVGRREADDPKRVDWRTVPKGAQMKKIDPATVKDWSTVKAVSNWDEAPKHVKKIMRKPRKKKDPI